MQQQQADFRLEKELFMEDWHQGDRIGQKRLGKSSSIGQLLTLGTLTKITEEAQILGILLSTV
jgi:hypothetical protein